jgi:hypothetical protein
MSQMMKREQEYSEAQSGWYKAPVSPGGEVMPTKRGADRRERDVAMASIETRGVITDSAIHSPEAEVDAGSITRMGLFALAAWLIGLL